MGWLISILTGPIVGAIVDVFKAYQNRKITEAEIEGEIKKAVVSALTTTIQTQGDVLKTALVDGSWLERNWRAFVAVSFSFVMLWYVLLQPGLVALFHMPPWRPGEILLANVMELVKIGFGGYITVWGLSRVIQSWRWR